MYHSAKNKYTIKELNRTISDSSCLLYTAPKPQE